MVSKRGVAIASSVVLAVGWLSTAVPRHLGAADLPAALSDRDFWRMIAEFSEPGGSFRSDNFVSNENAFQYVIPALQRRVAAGGAYLGVGPDQNFTYIVALQPSVAFVIDIRRQNMLEHLLYKALLEMSGDRAEFVSRLFSRPRPPGLDAGSPVRSLFDAYTAAAPSRALFDANLRAVTDRLVGVHHFGLTEDDRRRLEYVYTAFYEGGPLMTYTFLGGGPGWAGFPSYAQLMTETDGDGVAHGYLASEANFHALQALERNNLVVPVVGDFGGRKAIRAVGRYLRDHHATVGVFYTSNVEQYLFQEEDAWMRFLDNVGTLPIGPASLFIRSVNRGFSVRWEPARARAMPRIGSIADVLDAFHHGRVESYADVVAMSSRP